jgi:hypothetical protein
VYIWDLPNNNKTTKSKSNMASMKKNTKKKLRIINPDVCDECHLIDCCCEADKLQVIKDEANLKAKGYEPIDVHGNGDIRWVKPEPEPVKPEPEPVDKCYECDCGLTEDDEKFWCNERDGYVCHTCWENFDDAEKCDDEDCDCCGYPFEEE